MICKKCGREIPDDAVKCPYCGKKVKENKSAKPKKPIYKRVWFIILIVVVAVGAVIALMPSAGDKEVKEAKAMSKDTFMAKCENVDYKKIEKDSDHYIGHFVKADVRVEQEVDDSTLRAYSGSLGQNPDFWSKDEWILNDVRDNGEKLVEGDVVTVYGVYAGKESVDRAIGGSDEVPKVDLIYTAECEGVQKIQSIKKQLKFKMTKNEYGWKTYQAKLKNPTSAKFDYFSVELSLKKNGAVVESSSATVENWEPGEQAVFEFGTYKSFDQIVVKEIDY